MDFSISFVDFVIPSKIFINPSKNCSILSVVTAPSREGLISPSCSSIRKEYLTLCCGQLSISESLIIPTGSFSIMAFNMSICLCSRSNSNSMLLEWLWPFNWDFLDFVDLFFNLPPPWVIEYYFLLPKSFYTGRWQNGYDT